MTTHSMPDMTDKVVWITGGTRGIGLAAATELAQLGATVVLVGSTQESASAAAESLLARGLDAIGVGVDISQPQRVADLVGNHPLATQADVLINCAGVMSDKMAKTLRATSTEWDRVMGINFNGTLNMIQALAPNMVERRSGRVINVSACLGRFSGPGLAGGLAPYRISKTAVNALTKNLAAELGSGKRGILVDAMCPNHTRTDMGGPRADIDAPESAAGMRKVIAQLTLKNAGRYWMYDGSELPW
ncbi:MAG: SDR family NAD(P)-dependent oxidoreductase [Actinobacteria bacterium]|nr:SDR family NAD(P)-dependent oxidoreductase [Actinomycetota bacterium]